jgi:hypothetical protein
MADQTSFVTRSPEEKTAWVEQQRALGNKNILSKRDWYKKNEVSIRFDNMDKKMDLILSKLPK